MIDRVGPIEIEKGVYRILSSIGVIRSSNVYLVEDEDLILIDSGLPKDAKPILERISKLGHEPHELSHVVLTHYHLDHSGGAGGIKKRTGAKIVAHQADADYIAWKKKPRPFFRAAWRLFNYIPIQPDILVREGERLSGLRVLHTPGHTPGSICLLDERRKILFAGDAIRTFRNRIKGPGKIFGLDWERAVQSMKKISALDFDTLLPGHGGALKLKASKEIEGKKFRL